VIADFGVALALAATAAASTHLLSSSPWLPWIMFSLTASLPLFAAGCVAQVAEAVSPDLVIFVMDGSIGQAAFDQAKAFKESVEVRGSG
jgi:hypothetical protein